LGKFSGVWHRSTLLLGQVFNRSVNSSFIVLEALLKDADEMDEMVLFYDFYIL
jgi:hypothetical protein